ncbi:hypothetical protein P170DRAFT_409355 [Aspergillus steynii IBT 23096]|uniref:FAD binding domain protein n=1 Tax=Aspergillus steynii IBT 23096 TaxID=1392250 RepID=A0A2I2GA55_9EURO|nr:uncharacterized protein P170DRAFT_409355 [Aspergillus steynii IBT 23096]PLB49764.1 hypothetical protein P170DRAFT_409355 [Aspergillus steynii IBT 23096]
MLRGKLIKGVASGIGLASESITAYKAGRKQNGSEEHTPEPSPPSNSFPPPHCPSPNYSPYQPDHIEDHHEEEWQLDEAQDQLGHDDSPPGYTPTQDVDQLAHVFLESHPTSYAVPQGHPVLPYPVILPQRRPRDRKRGFIRAYAPVLDDFGIDQATFIDFLDTSNKACQASGWIGAINLASIGTMFMPSAIGMAVSVAIQIGTDVAIAAENRRKTNTYFDKINQEMYHPRGLHCLIMTWKPDSESPYVSFDLNSTVSQSIDHGPGTETGWMNKMKHKYKSSDGKTYGDLPFRETAPLVFPDLDELARQSGDAEKKLKEKHSRREFVGDYLDRRGQAQFMMENPTSDLNMAPKPQFTSRYADPSHPANSGSLISLVTGGHVNPDELIGGRRAGGGRREGGRRGYDRGVGGGLLGRRQGPISHIINGVQNSRSGEQYPAEEGYREGPASAPGYGARNPRERLRGPRGDGPLGGIKKKLQSNVLYLMIVNLPSEEEMRQARGMMRS